MKISLYILHSNIQFPVQMCKYFKKKLATKFKLARTQDTGAMFMAVNYTVPGNASKH